MSIHPATRMGPVHYTVRDLKEQVAFYRDLLGFRLIWQEGNEASLGTHTRELLRLTEDKSAPIPRGTTGLYHTAFLVPTRWDLANLVQRIIDARVPVQGHSNHGTHLALYLPDPEGNGIELAWDFPRDEWPMRDGKMLLEAMPREGINIPQLLAELEKRTAPWSGLPDETVVGHVHLHVARLDESKRFYHGILGFDVTADAVSMGALFVSAGGYHHHIGMNVWKGVGAPPPPDGAVGLRSFTIALPSLQEQERIASRAREAGVAVTRTDDGLLLKDPAQNTLVLAVA